MRKETPEERQKREKITIGRLIAAAEALRDLGTLSERLTWAESKDLAESALLCAHILRWDEELGS